MKCVFLLDFNGTFIDSYYLKEGESVYLGSMFEFPCHKVDVDEHIQSDEKKMKLLKRKRPDGNYERTKELRRVRSPQATLLGSSIGMFTRVTSSRKGLSPQAKQSESNSPSILNVIAHFPSPILHRGLDQ
jgi:hypothetical protein